MSQSMIDHHAMHESPMMRSMIDRGLVIAAPWIDKILDGEKTWEIRSRRNSRVGMIALCRKGGPIVGTCVIGESIPLPRERFARHFARHRVSAAALEAFYRDRPVFAWPLSEVRRIDPPIAYKHPSGGSWVTLSPRNVPDYRRLKAAASP